MGVIGLWRPAERWSTSWTQENTKCLHHGSALAASQDTALVQMPELGDPCDQGNAGKQPANLRRRGRCSQALLQLGNQVSQGDIDIAAAGQGEPKGQPFFMAGDQAVANHTAQDRDPTGQAQFDERAARLTQA
ncbi:MAG: hypothetical protein EBV15_09015, partial [Bacteroidetes bacterium]|nr:hypothetical protein [Bacteroidota bacterium]